MKALVPSDGRVALARAMLLAVVVSTLFTTSVSIVIELLTYLLFLVSPVLLRRFFGRLGHRVNVALICFAVIVDIAALYAPLSWTQAAVAVFEWRRILLLPLAFAVFDDARSKRLALKVIVVSCVVGALISFVTEAGTIEVTPRLSPGIVFHNYATQGLAMSLAATVCLAALLRPAAFAGDRLLGRPAVMAVALAVLSIDVVFVLWGRTGYLALIVMSFATVLLLAPGTWRRKALAALAAALCGVALLAASPHVRSRVAAALEQIRTVDTSTLATPVGVRLVMWRTTLRMVRDHPILGVGTEAFAQGYHPYVQGVRGWQGDDTGDPHNQFLKILGEQGIVGLAAFLSLLYCAFTSPGCPPYRQLAVAALIGWCATSFANSDFSTHTESRLIFFWLGAMLGAAAPPQGSEAGHDFAIGDRHVS